METAAAQAAYEDLHKERPFHDGTFTRWSKTRSRKFPYHYGDGVRFGVAEKDLTPHDDFTRVVSSSPVEGLVPQQAPGEQDEPDDEAAEEHEPSGPDDGDVEAGGD